MDFSQIHSIYDGENLVEFPVKWNNLPTPETSPFPGLDAFWKPNLFSPYSSTFSLPQAIHRTHPTRWSPSSFDSGETPDSASMTSHSPGASLATSIPYDVSLSSTAEYHPRGPSGKRKGPNRRITPKSKKHAHELSRNRTAATKYRNRQKTYVDSLQQKARDAETIRTQHLKLVQSLRDELFDLRCQLLRHASCSRGKSAWTAASAVALTRPGTLPLPSL